MMFPGGARERTVGDTRTVPQVGLKNGHMAVGTFSGKAFGYKVVVVLAKSILFLYTNAK